MELELKHIAPYLPYGLMVGKYFENNFFSEEMDISTMASLFNDTRKKPILRPLSDLTKEIEVNGEKFIPLDKINGLNSFGECLFIQDCENSKAYNKLDWWTEFEGGFHFEEMQICYQLLLKWHFNVFNLPEHLFIDINTL
jgi:hypothetical protein